MARFRRRPASGVVDRGVSACGITVVRGGVEVLRDVAFDVSLGEVVGIFARGDNEIGLAALTAALAGEVAATRGMVAWRGVRVLHVPLPGVRGLPVAATHPDLTTVLGLAPTATVREVIRAAAGAGTDLFGVDADVDAAIDGIQLGPVCGDSDTESLGDIEYRSGRLARVLTALAIAWMRDEDVWVLDVPTLGLDRDEAVAVMGVIRGLARNDSLDRAVIFSAVSMCDACHGTRVLELAADGTLGTFSDLSESDFG